MNINFENLKETLKKVKPVETIILAGVILALIVGYATFKHYRQTASKQIEATSKISFDVFIRGITLTADENPIKQGDTTFISIRNVPYTDLTVQGVRSSRKKVVLPTINTKKVMVVDDVSQANMYDVTVSLTDEAKITKDGAVVGGNKIKIGLPITLEGKNYKFNGTVSDLKVIHNIEDKALNDNNDVQ